jgi:hypothetical protein
MASEDQSDPPQPQIEVICYKQTFIKDPIHFRTTKVKEMFIPHPYNLIVVKDNEAGLLVFHGKEPRLQHHFDLGGTFKKTFTADSVKRVKVNLNDLPDLLGYLELKSQIDSFFSKMTQ